MNLQPLREVAGELLIEHAAFGARTTYRVGGSARGLLNLTDLETLRRCSEALMLCDAPLVVLGNGSNMLVADGEFNGIVLKLGVGFEQFEFHLGSNVAELSVGAALDLPIVARRISDLGVRGFEWAVGVPGTVGGAAVMNAGGHGSDFAHCVDFVDTWSFDSGEPQRWTLEELHYQYRQSALGAGDLVMTANLRFENFIPDAEAARAQIKQIVRWRREHQPGGANAGSVFRNPPGNFAGALIEAAGMKGHRHGTAMVSDKHANFFQLDPSGRADDVVALMSQVREAVEQHSGVRLESEIRMIGFLEGSW